MLIILFTYFYTAVQFNPLDQADNLKKYGGFIPGIRPGRPTAAVPGPGADAHHLAGRPLPGGHRGAAHCSSGSSTCPSTSAARRC